jgi:hypothetical protein
VITLGKAVSDKNNEMKTKTEQTTDSMDDVTINMPHGQINNISQVITYPAITMSVLNCLFNLFDY